jgi:hypothetical protein
MKFASIFNTSSVWLLLAGLGASGLPAAGATISAVADSTLTEHSALGGAAANLGGNPLLYSIGTSTFRSLPIIRFDLTAFAGQTVAGPGTLQLRVSDTYQSQGVTNTLELYSIVIAWLENSVTWNNFGVFPGPDATADFATPALHTQTVTVTPGSTITFTVPQTVLQGWINTPASNNGFLIFNTTSPSFMDISFASRTNGTLTGPELTFSTADELVVTPEPSSLLMALFSLGVGAVAAARRARG